MPIAQMKTSNANKLASDVIEQIGNDFETNTEQTENQDGKKYSDTIIARLSKGKRAIFKSFFSRHGITMTSGIEMCVEYVMSQIENGNATISKAGVK